MPYAARKGAHGRWTIKNTRTGKIVGTSSSKARAQASARARNSHRKGRR